MIKLSPSDLTFLYEDCKRCFWRKVVRGVSRPSMPMAGIFKKVDTAMQGWFLHMRTGKLFPELPSGIITHGEEWVQSKPLRIGKQEIYIKGKLDGVISFMDGSFAVVDYKTSGVKDTYLQIYSRQLQAYAWALEHPDRGALALFPVTKLGLIIFEPAQFISDISHVAMLHGRVGWQEIEKNDKAFLGFLTEVSRFLTPTPPHPEPNCAWCSWKIDI